MSAAQSRIELIARVFAETGVKDLFYAILENIQKHQDQQKVIRLRNEWVPMDPREWTEKFDLSVMVGLGTGSKEMQMAALAEESQFQLAALTNGLPVVTPENVYNLRMKALEAKNIKGGDLFYTHPSKIPPAPPQQDPAILKAQIDGQVKAGLQEMKNQAAAEKQASKQDFDALKEQFKASQDLQKQREQQAVELQKQREQQAGDAQMQREGAVMQSVESDKDRKQDNDAKLIDIIWEKKKGQDDAERSAQQEEMKAILNMIQDNTKAQNEAILKMIEASLAERETEVSERDKAGKVKKTVSRVKK